VAVKHLLTSEGEKLLESLREDPSYIPWKQYPRPQLYRDSFLCLNGQWTFCTCSPEQAHQETILVPYPPESRLSGICRNLGKDPDVYYRRSFRLPEGFRKDRVILHFGAVDQIARIVLNGYEIGTHCGGYDSFSLEITEHILYENILEVYVSDRLSDGILPYGKQRYKRGGMWYTPITGIWQSVWLESVPEVYIRELQITNTLDTVTIQAEGIDAADVEIETPDGNLISHMHNGKVRFEIPNPRNWTPDDPYLYYFTVRTESDAVRSYFALRTLETAVVNGIPRICLNGKPIFLHGLLDQGYYSDGIYTPASPESYTNDILAMKAMGFNTLRKHIKVEPEHFYFECDRLGMLVIQDMVNNGRYSFIRDTALPTIGFKKMPDRRMHNHRKQRKTFVDSAERTIRQLQNHPCICCWTIFNEGWGQFDSTVMYESLRGLDKSRIIDTASGWFNGGKSDLESIHVYFKPVKIKSSPKPVLLSEFGGYSCCVPEHAYQPDKSYGYRLFTDRNKFAEALFRLYKDEIAPIIASGLCGAIYTQVSDVEDETNGLLTYDRKICKIDVEVMKNISRILYNSIQ